MHMHKYMVLVGFSMVPSDSEAQYIFIYTSTQHCPMVESIIMDREQHESLNSVPNLASFLW